MGTMLEIGPDRSDLPKDTKLGKWYKQVLSNRNIMWAIYAN